MQRAWRETPVGGSPEAERLEFDRLAREIMRVQLKTAKTASAHGVPHGVDRAFHAKSTLAVDNAELRFLDLPEELRAGFAQPGAVVPDRGPVLQRVGNTSGGHRAGPARSGAARAGVSGRDPRPADDELPGLPRS